MTEKESAASRVAKLLRKLEQEAHDCSLVPSVYTMATKGEILDIVRGLEETIEILSDKERMKSLEKSAESLRRHGSRPYKEAKVKP